MSNILKSSLEKTGKTKFDYIKTNIIHYEKNDNSKLANIRGNNIFIKDLIKISNNMIITLFIIINLIIQIFSYNKIEFLYTKYSNITLKIKGEGIKKILNSYFVKSYPPYQVYINENLQNTVNYSYNFNETDNLVKLIWKDNNISCYNMFYDCRDIYEFDFSYFDTSQVTHMDYMFIGCSSLISLDLSNFITSKVTDMDSMFSGCSSLSSLDLSNFNTSNIIYMDHMFYNCSSLISLDLSNFITSKVIDMGYMFSGCSSLISLDLSNFNTTQVYYMDYMFYGCNKLHYINLKNFDESGIIGDYNYYKQMFYGVPDNVIVCINETTTKNYIFPQLENKTNFINNCSYNWVLNTIKIQIEIVGNIKDNIEDKLKDLINIDINETKGKEEEIKYYDNILKNIEDIFSSENYDTSKLDKGEDEKISIKKLIITLSNLNKNNNSEDNNMTLVNLGECEILLRKFYNLSLNKQLYMKKIDVCQDGMKIPKVEYDIYTKLSGNGLEKLNLTICKNIKISMTIPVTTSDNKDILNSSSEYYNDLCYSAKSESGTDIILKDRKNEFIDGNKMVCPDDCDFLDYNSSSQKAECLCDAKGASSSFEFMNINKTKLYENFQNIKNIANINLLHCYKNLFSKEGLIKNIGFYLIIIIIIFHIVCILFFYLKDLKIIINKIKDIIYGKRNSKLIKVFKKENKENIGEKNENIKNEINNNKMDISPNKMKKNKKIKNKKKIKKKNIINNNINGKDEIPSNNKLKKDDKKIKNKTSAKDEAIEKINKIMEYTNVEINILPYELALRIDNRTYCVYYISLLKIKHIIIFTFLNNNDYNSKILKIDLFAFGFILYYTVNALFYNDSTIHNIYKTNGSFNIYYQLPKIIYSSLISLVLNTLSKKLALSSDTILEFKQMKIKKNIKKKGKELIKNLKIRFIIYFIASFIFLFLFGYYLSMFGAIYRNSQFHLLKDTLVSFGLSLIYPFGIYLLPGIFRIPSLSNHKKKRKILYNFSKLIQVI